MSSDRDHGGDDVEDVDDLELLASELDLDVAAIEEEESLADRRLAAIVAGRRKGGLAGAAMAGAMFAISEIYEGPKSDEMVAVSESPDDPGDIDSDGIEMRVGEVDVWAPPPPSHD